MCTHNFVTKVRAVCISLMTKWILLVQLMALRCVTGGGGSQLLAVHSLVDVPQVLLPLDRIEGLLPMVDHSL